MSRFSTRVVAWHSVNGRHDLPWQQTRDAYRIWLSEIMLQQTQVATVIPYYQRFLESFPDVTALDAAPLERVLEHWSGLGYYRRAHHLHAAAQAVVRDHGGVFRAMPQRLRPLPGIGRSTAAAIAAFATEERVAILEGNVKRVLARHRGIEGYPGVPAVQTTLWKIATELLPKRDVAIYTQAMMDLGATVCTRTKPRCDVCPVADDCVARRDGRTAQLPTPRPKKALPQRACACSSSSTAVRSCSSGVLRPEYGADCGACRKWRSTTMSPLQYLRASASPPMCAPSCRKSSTASRISR
jgi:A/G-specific adenine glycosylase